MIVHCIHNTVLENISKNHPEVISIWYTNADTLTKEKL